MNEKLRNTAVGLTVLVAMVILGGLVVLFGQLPSILQAGYPLKMHFADSGGIVPGCDVRLAGQRVGRITEVTFTDNDARLGVDMTARIESAVRIPGDVNPYITSKSFTGGVIVELRSDNRPPGNKRDMPWLPTDGSLALKGGEEGGGGGGGGLIPADVLAEVRGTLTSFRRLSDNLNNMFANPTTMPTSAQSGNSNIHVTLGKLNDALDAVHEVLGSEENQKNIKTSLADLAKATAAAVETLNAARTMIAHADVAVTQTADSAKNLVARFDDLAGKLIADADAMGLVLTSLYHTTEKIDKGEGTLGKLVNDPALYNNMVDLTGQIKASIATLDELMTEWKKGVPIKLK